MRKILVCLLVGAVLLLSGTAQAGTLRKTIIDAVTLDDDPTSVTSSVVNVQQADSTGFFLDYDETEVGGIQVAITIQISYDGTTWLSGSFYDLGGGPATFQTTETLTADGSYFFWLEKASNVSRVRVVVTATGSDSDDTAIIDAFVVVNQ